MIGLVSAADNSRMETTAPVMQPALNSTNMLWLVGAIFLARLIVIGTGIASLHTPPLPMPVTASGTPWVAWDAIHYREIADEGYPTQHSDFKFQNIAYFPLVPLIARLLSSAIPTELALVIVANLCSLVGFAVFFLWVRNLTRDIRTAVIATLFIAMWPGAVFLSAGMTEGPFFLFVATSLYFLQRRRFWIAAIACAFATLTRPTGIAVAATLGLFALIQLTQYPFWKRFAIAVLIGLVASSGTIVYQAFLIHRFGQLTAYTEAQHRWKATDDLRIETIKAQGIEPPRSSLKFYITKAETPPAWNRVLAVLILGITLIGFIEPGPIHRALFCLPLAIFLMTAIPDHFMRISSVIRYETAGLPFIALLAVWLSDPRRKPLAYTTLAFVFAVQIYYAYLFSRGLWVG